MSYDTKLDPTVIDHLNGKNGKAQSNYVTFSEDPGSYFVKHNARGGWGANIEEPYVQRISALRKDLKDFDLGLKGIVFGKGGTHFYQFEAGFMAVLKGDAESPQHPLNKVPSGYSCFIRRFDACCAVGRIRVHGQRRAVAAERGLEPVFLRQPVLLPTVCAAPRGGRAVSLESAPEDGGQTRGAAENCRAA